MLMVPCRPSTLCYARYRMLMVPCRPSTLCYSRHRGHMIPRWRHLHSTSLHHPRRADPRRRHLHSTSLQHPHTPPLTDDYTPSYSTFTRRYPSSTTPIHCRRLHDRPLDRPVRSRESIATGDIPCRPSPPIPRTIDQLPLSDRRFFTHYGMRSSFHELLYEEFLVHTIRIIIL
jgi:hypothetical protein